MHWVRCISLWQPWASLMACGAKLVETRHWRTEVRGEVYIHAAKTTKGIAELELLPDECEQIRAMTYSLGLKVEQWRTRLPFGKLVAAGNLSDCLPASQALRAYPLQEPFGDFSAGRWGHIYTGLRAIEWIPYRGSQGFFSACIEEGEQDR